MTIINKLYELASSGDLDAASELKGYLHLQTGDRTKIEYLTNMFPNKLFITASNYIIPFEDQNMVTYLNSIGVGSNGVITEADAAAATIVANSQNTTVTKFNELKYFTQITQSRGGISGSSEGLVRFRDWTALEEVDISNFTSIGHSTSNGQGDTFRGCTSLKKITASNKLTAFGQGAFRDCQNLEEITGLDGTITIYKDVFLGCKKLKNSCFANVEFLFVGNGLSSNAFKESDTPTIVTLSDSNTFIPESCFFKSKVTTVNIPLSITTFENSCFMRSPLSIDASLLSHGNVYENNCFRETSITGTFAPTNLTTLGVSSFQGCSSLQGVDLSSTSLTFIDEDVFSGATNLVSAVLPSTCTKLGPASFKGCSNLTSINLANVTEFNNNCLYGCSSLHITQNDIANAVSIGSNAFSQVASLPSHLVLSHLTGIGGWPWSDPNIISADFTGSTFTYVNAGLFEA